MYEAPVHHRPPRAGIDPIGDAADALAALSLALHWPLRAETIVMLLDDERRGITLVVVSGTRRPDDVVEVIERLADPAAHGGRVAAIVAASIRPGAGRNDLETDRVDDDHSDTYRIDADVDRWLEMSDLAAQSGVELVEWFVVGPDRADVSCPRDRLGEPPRW